MTRKYFAFCAKSYRGTGAVNFTKQKMEKSPEVKFQGLLFLWEGGFFLHCNMLY